MSKHTPGPWTACDNNGYSIWRITAAKYRAESESRTIAEVVGDSAETEANARLIAAATEMIDLLYRIRGHIDSTCHECESKAIVPEIDALIDKIEGGGGE